jgi:ribosomal protein S18 acetylase RimI-like enzyme
VAWTLGTSPALISTVTLEDWARTPARELAPFYAAEAARWRDALAWESHTTWAALERARVAREVPGLVARTADGRVVGWTFYLRRRAELQIGALSAPEDAVPLLLDAVLASPEAQGASRAMVFGFLDARLLAGRLAERRFLVGTYHYLVRDVAGAQAADRAIRPWRQTDLLPAAAILKAAYQESDPLRPFGGAGRVEDWIEYLYALTTTDGCGQFAPDLSLVAADAAGALTGLALVTRVAPATAHLAQAAVDPRAQRQGLGRRLLTGALAGAAAAGALRMSLLVSDRNTAARELYCRCGFAPRAAFLSASNVRLPAPVHERRV